ncbi:MAG: glycosyltransferase [Chloroflexi bacterium]|nr:glycosyltransferase [Chloroflexota bacterium]
MTNPLITVLMTTYNVEKYVAEAVDSVLSQTFPDFELLVVEDGSLDATPEILRRYSDERIRIVRTENRGLTSALNTGLEAARSEFIARMDSDDACYPTRLEEELKAFQASEGTALVGSWYDIIDEDGTLLATKTMPSSDMELKAALPIQNPFCHGSVMFRKAAVEAVGGYRPQFKASQDYDLWLRLSERYSMSVVPKTLYRWRLRRSGVATSARMLQRAYAKVALDCCLQRRSGKPETLPAFTQRPRGSSRNPLRRLERESGYAAHKSSILLQSGQRWRAGRLAARSMACAPWSIVAWAAAARVCRAALARRQGKAKNWVSTGV